MERIQQAIDYIESHLCDELTIESIATRAAYSSWHFQRIFAAIVGQTVGGYVRRRRLSNALAALRTRKSKIADVAWEHGFESHEAFTRAFKATFGITPGQARRGAIPQTPPLAAFTLSCQQLHQQLNGPVMEPAIRELDEMAIIGLGSPFISILSSDPDRNNFAVIPSLWDNLFKRIGEIEHRHEKFSLGLCGDLPDGMERTHNDQFYYIAGVPVSSLKDVPEGMVTAVVSKRSYAVFTHHGPIDRLGETMNYIYGSWLPNSSYQRADGKAFDLEWYDERFDHASEESEMDIYIPLA